MVRVIIFLIVVGLAALGFAWLADRPGAVTITWLGWRVDTSVTVLAAVVALLAAAVAALWSLLRLLLRSPKLIARARRGRRRERGYRAMSAGLIAIGGGNVAAARKFASEANRLTPGEPLALLLSAQTAQLSGDRATAERVFREMAGRADTRLLGLRGLYIEAQRRDDPAAARLYAEQAAKSSAAVSWAGHAVLQAQCATGDWEGALVSLENQRKGGLIDKATYRRHRAVLLVARVASMGDHEREQKTLLAVEATKLAPDLAPAATLAGRLLAEVGEINKAAKILETAWRLNPHPDLPETYAYLKPGETARARLNRVQTLVRHLESHPESALALARAALDAREFARARSTLAPLLPTATKRVATLMAELETVEHGDEGRAREWMARALRAAPDPAWMAEGFVSDRWMPVSPISGKLDAFQWRTPTSALAVAGPMIEETKDTRDAPAAEDITEAMLADASPENLPEISRPAVASERAAPASPPRRPPERAIDPVIPLVHAPDDPGPEPEPNPVPAVDGRRGLRLFFR
jgi:HemY protein